MIEHRRIANIRQTAQMPILKRLIARRVEIPIPHPNLIDLKPGLRFGHLRELPRQILPLLRGALRRRWQRCQLAINLLQQLAQLAEIQRARVIGVVLLEEGVEAAHVVARLRELVFHLLGDLAPVLEGNLQGLGVAAVFGGDGLQEGDDVVGDVVRDRGAVAYRVDGGLRGAEEAEVRVGG